MQSIITPIISQAVAILKQGGLVGMPTETVYGLGADAENPKALEKIFQVKQRPTNHPLIVHLADIAQLNEWAGAISPLAQCLADAFWPGPLTLILPKASQVLDLVTGGQPSIGLRIPSHPVAQALLKAFGSGIAAPSANRFGRISPTTADHVREELGEAVDLVLEGGACDIGLESTIVDVTRGYPVILRPGMITSTDIEAVLDHAHLSLSQEAIYSNTPPRVSGSLNSHYAPQTPTKLLTIEEIILFLENIKTHQLPLALMAKSPGFFTQKIRKDIYYVRMPLDFHAYAHDLYEILHQLDNKNFKQIIIEDVPLSPDWAAIRDRLLKASFVG
jgi:L-threonylcarbamoyladenylate synthase